MELELLGGHVALDFANSLEDGGATGPRDHLVDLAAFAHWCRLAGLCDANGVEKILNRAAHDPNWAMQKHKDAITLRTTVADIFRRVCFGELPSKSTVAALDTRVGKANRQRQLEIQDSGAVEWRWRDRADLVDLLMYEIAFDAAALLTDSEQTANIKMCGGDDCTWMFLDETKNKRRRWCKMSTCGNKAKARTFRQRKAAY